jgi:t-SNARE complex subunit (syntaxin)
MLINLHKVKSILNMQKINKLKAQIKALNSRIEQGKVKNIYPVQNKIKSLKMALKIELDKYNWETYLSK